MIIEVPYTLIVCYPGPTVLVLFGLGEEILILKEPKKCRPLETEEANVELYQTS